MTEARPEQIELSVSVERTVYESDLEPPDKPASKTVMYSTSPVPLLPPIAAVCVPLTGTPKLISSVIVEALAFL